MPVGLPERQLFTQGGLVDLDDLDACGFEVEHFVADGEGQLLGLLLVGDVLAWPGPVENSDRAGEHALHHMAGTGLCVGAPFHGDRVGAGHVAPYDRRLHTTGAVGLHPSVLGEQETVEVLAEVFDHIVTLEFAVHEHVKADLLLMLDAGVDLRLHVFVVFSLGDFALAQSGAFGAHFLGLREGSDGGGRQQWQVQRLPLCLLTFGTCRLAHEVRVGQGCETFRHVLVGGDAGTVEERLVGCQCPGCLLVFLAGVGENREVVQFAELFNGEGEMLAHIIGETVFTFGAERHMQQGACGGDGHVVGDLLQRVDESKADGVIVTPDVAAVDHTGEDGGALCDAELFNGGEILVLAFVEVESDAVEGEQVDCLIHVGDVAEVGVEQHLDLAVACGQDLGVQALEQFDVARLLVEHEVRFVDLDPFGAQLGELGHDLGVDGGDRVDQALVVFEFFGLRIAGELEEGVRADEHRLGGDAERLRLVEFVERLGAVELDVGGGVDFRHEVVVVGGEPLLHRQGGHVTLLALIAAAHCEEGLFRVLEGETLVALRNDVEQDGSVEHLVVIAEVVARNQVDGGGALLQLPMLGAQFLGGGTHLVEGGVALPIRFDDFLQLTVLADARETGDGSKSGHESSI